VTPELLPPLEVLEPDPPPDAPEEFNPGGEASGWEATLLPHPPQDRIRRTPRIDDPGPARRLRRHPRSPTTRLSIFFSSVVIGHLVGCDCENPGTRKAVPTCCEHDCRKRN
jgi:hypothetical protein